MPTPDVKNVYKQCGSVDGSVKSARQDAVAEVVEQAVNEEEQAPDTLN